LPKYNFVQLDVFTDRAFAGNPLAVFPEAHGLTDEQMQQIAREMNVSVRTVEAHRQSIKRKLSLECQAELIKYAVEHAGARD